VVVDCSPIIDEQRYHTAYLGNKRVFLTEEEVAAIGAGTWRIDCVKVIARRSGQQRPRTLTGSWNLYVAPNGQMTMEVLFLLSRCRSFHVPTRSGWRRRRRPCASALSTAFNEQSR
jgi:hypothetical protein